MSHSDYGDIVLTRHPDGQITIAQADPIVGFSAEVLRSPDPTKLSIDADGNLVVVGQLTYRPIRFADGGRIVVCEQVGE